MNTSENILKWGDYEIVKGVSTQDAAAEYLNEVDGFGFTRAWGGDPAVVASLTGYKMLRIGDRDCFEVDLSSFLGTPEFVSLTGKPAENVDLRHNVFSKATRLQLELCKKTKVFGSLSKLEQLTLSGPAPFDISLLKRFPNLTSLNLVQMKFGDLDGIEVIPQLRELSIAHNPRPLSLETLSATKLRSLELEHCNKIQSYEALGKLGSLESLTVDSCNRFSDLNFVTESHSLKRFRFVCTVVESGDLEPLLKLEEVGFLDRKGYSHREADILESIAARIR